MKLKNKAQNASQIFVYIIALVIVAVILLFGYNAIKGFSEKQDQIAVVKFQNDLRSSIKSVISEYGTLKQKTLTLANKYSEVCFVTNYWESSAHHNPEDFTGYPIIWDAVESETEKNVFLLKKTGELEESLSIDNVLVDNEGKTIKCIALVSGKVSFTLEGKGDHVLIS